MESSWLAGQEGLVPDGSPAHSSASSLLQMVPLTPRRTYRKVSVLIPQDDLLKGCFFPSRLLQETQPSEVRFCHLPHDE